MSAEENSDAMSGCACMYHCRTALDITCLAFVFHERGLRERIDLGKLELALSVLDSVEKDVVEQEEVVLGECGLLLLHLLDQQRVFSQEGAGLRRKQRELLQKHVREPWA